MKIKVLLVDDEAKSRVVLRSLLENLFPEIEIVAEAENVEEAFLAVNAHLPGLVFLDIQMPGGDGFNLLRKWEEVPFEVIFVTSFDTFMIDAIRFSALDYLLKPVEVDDLKNAVTRAIQKAKNKERNRNKVQIGNMLNSLGAEIKDRKIAVHVRDKVKLLPVMSIAYIEADTSWCRITMDDGEQYMIAKNLKEFDEFFSGVTVFIRVHKSYLINVNFIIEYSKGEPFIITMHDQKIFEVARRKKREILALVNMQK
ncbi:LytTR family DNA-binding domain-containing protein [soil metagenome]